MRGVFKASTAVSRAAMASRVATAKANFPAVASFVRPSFAKFRDPSSPPPPVVSRWQQWGGIVRPMCTDVPPTPKPASSKKPSSWSRQPGAPAPPKRDPNLPAVHEQAQPPSDPWTPVVDPATGGTYYWNQQSDEVTAIGEPKPVGFYRMQPAQVVYEPQSMMGQIGGMMLWGAGISIGFAIVGAAFRMLFG